LFGLPLGLGIFYSILLFILGYGIQPRF